MRRWLDRVARRLVLPTVWMAATLIAGAVAWSAVARLGQEGMGSSTALTQSDVRRDLAQPPTTPTSTAGTQPRPPTTPAQPSPSTTSTSAGATTPPSGSHGSGPPPSGSANPPETPPRRSHFWTLDGGSVGASCQGEVLTLLYATPRDGWSMQRSVDPSELSVTFSHGDSESELRVVCSAGIPTARHGGYGGGHDGGRDGGD